MRSRTQREASAYPLGPMSSDPTPHDSLDILRRLRDGDASALPPLMERFQSSLLARIRLMMGDRARDHAESTDFLQATFVEVLERIDAVKPPDEKGLLRWMTWIARNKIRNHMRTERDQRLESLSNSLSRRGPADTASGSPDEIAAHGEELELLAEAIESLPSDLRRVVELRELEGLAFASVGAALGLGEDQARWVHRKAMLRLGIALGVRGGS